MRFGDIDLACELDVRPGPGHDVTLAIRPEDVVVRNVVAGTAQHVHRARRRRRVSGLVLPRGACDQRRASPRCVADFSINVVRDLAIAEGKEMLIALPPDRLRVFPRAPQEP